MRLFKTKKEDELKKLLGRYFSTVSSKKDFVSEVGFEPTPTEVDCDLNAAP